MAKKNAKSSKGKGASKGRSARETGSGAASGVPKLGALLEELSSLPPQDRIASARPFWESLSLGERRALLAVSVEELREYARKVTQRERKHAAAESSSGAAVVAPQPPPDLEEVLEEGLRRSAEKGTWKVWQWPATGAEFLDSESFRRFMETELMSGELRRLLPRDGEAAQLQGGGEEEAGGKEVGSGGKRPTRAVEKPTEAALRQRMSELLQRVHAANRSAQEEEAQFRHKATAGRGRGGGGGGTAGGAAADAMVGGTARDVNAELITLIMTALEKEHEYLYHLVLYPLTAHLAELLPETSRDSSRTELFYEDLDKLPPEEVARICEWVTEKLDSFSAKLKPEAKELEEEGEEEEPIGDADLFCLTEGGSALIVHPKWLAHLQDRQLGEDGQPRKSRPGEDPHRLGLVLEWVYGTIVSTAEKGRDGAKRALGSRLPHVEPALEELLTDLRDMAACEARARASRELLAEMVQSRKEAKELAAKLSLGAGQASGPDATEATTSAPNGGQGPAAAPALPGAPPPQGTATGEEGGGAPAQVPDAAMLSMLRREVLLTRAKLHFLEYQQLSAERMLRSLKAQLRQGEPEFDRLKREVEEVKNHQRGLEGTYRTSAEMERHRAQLADAAIEEQIEVQTAFREQGQRLQRIYDHRRETEVLMARREQEMKQLGSWKATVQQIINQLEEALQLSEPLQQQVTEDVDVDVEAQVPDSNAARALMQAVQSVTQQDSQLSRLRQHFHQDIMRQLYTDDNDRAFFDTINKQLREIEKRMEEGRAALQHVESFVINVACDDPGAAVGAQLLLPLLQERLDAKALEYAAQRAEQAQQEVIRMEAEHAEREKQEKEKKAKQKQKAKEKLRSEKERERAEREARLKAEEERRLEEQRIREREAEEERRRRADELEALRRAEEETMERRRQELLADENSHWRQRMEAESLLAQQAQQEREMSQQALSSELSDSANEAEQPPSSSMLPPGAAATREMKRRQQHQGGNNPPPPRWPPPERALHPGTQCGGSSNSSLHKAEQTQRGGVHPATANGHAQGHASIDSGNGAGPPALVRAGQGPKQGQPQAVHAVATAPRSQQAQQGPGPKAPFTELQVEAAPAAPEKVPSKPSVKEWRPADVASKPASASAAPLPPSSPVGGEASPANKPPPSHAPGPVIPAQSVGPAPAGQEAPGPPGPAGPADQPRPGEGQPVAEGNTCAAPQQPPAEAPTSAPHQQTAATEEAAAVPASEPHEQGQQQAPAMATAAPPTPPMVRPTILQPHDPPPHASPAVQPPAAAPSHPHPPHPRAHLPLPPQQLPLHLSGASLRERRAQHNLQQQQQQQQQQGPHPAHLQHHPHPSIPLQGPTLGGVRLPPPPFTGAPFPPHPAVPLPHPAQLPMMYLPGPPLPITGPPPQALDPSGRGPPRPTAAPYAPMPGGVFPAMPMPAPMLMGPPPAVIPMRMPHQGAPHPRPTAAPPAPRQHPVRAGSSSSGSGGGTTLRVTAQPFVPSSLRMQPPAAAATPTPASHSPPSAESSQGGGSSPLREERTGAAGDGEGGPSPPGGTCSAAEHGTPAGSSPRGPLDAQRSAASSSAEAATPASAGSSTSGEGVVAVVGLRDGAEQGGEGQVWRQHAEPVKPTAQHAEQQAKPQLAPLPQRSGADGRESQPPPPGRSKTATGSDTAPVRPPPPSSSQPPSGATKPVDASTAALALPASAAIPPPAPSPGWHTGTAVAPLAQVDVHCLRLVRGMTNAPGLYNCFLNVVVQCLWHLAPFRRAMLAVPPQQLTGRGAAQADERIMKALWKVFRDMDAPPAPPPAQQASASGGGGGGSSSQAMPRPAVSAAALREALTGLRGGAAAAAAFDLSDMHDAAEVLGEVFDAMHRAQQGAAAAAAGDPTLPRKVRVQRSTLQHPQPAAAEAIAKAAQKGELRHGSEGGPAMLGPAAGETLQARPLAPVWANSSALAKVKQAPQPQQEEGGLAEGLVMQLFGQEVQVPCPPISSSSPHPSAANPSGPGPRQLPAAAVQSSNLDGMVEVLQYVKYFHLVPAQGLRTAYEAARVRHGMQPAAAAQSQQASLPCFEELLLAAETASGRPHTKGGPVGAAAPGASSPTTRLLRRPQVMALGLVWESPQTPQEAIASTMKAVGTQLDASRLYRGPVAGPPYVLRCLMCYHRSHYRAFALSEEAGQWLLFDDARVELVGSWGAVVDAVVQGRMQPSVLFYEARR